MDYYGNWIHYPREGAALDQDEYEMDCIRHAWAVERIWARGSKDDEFKKANGSFRYWVLSGEEDGDTWLNPWLEE